MPPQLLRQQGRRGGGHAGIIWLAHRDLGGRLVCVIGGMLYTAVIVPILGLRLVRGGHR